MQNIVPDTVIDERYRVRSRIGSGGMADVYCATDLQLGRPVALKLLHRRFAEDQEFVERFRREASSAAGLQHPNVVGVFDRGEWDGTYYIAMEFLEGRNLKELVRDEGRLAPERAADLIGQVLRAARFAHRRGIIHRDFKPHNVIVDAEGRAKVTDFGIAKAGASDMTETGSIMGTAQYLSPEQAQGHAVSAQSDLYSIGIMLYELLTGRVPFGGDSPVTVALKQVAEEPIPPAELNPAISPQLEAVVMRALRKDPAARFQDADAFIAALEQALGLPEAAPTGIYPAVPYPPPPPLARRPGAGVDDLERADRRNLRRLALWGFLLLALAGIAYGGYLLLAPDKVRVPDVVRNTSAIASARLQNEGFGVDIQMARSEDVPEDRVFRQDPNPGERVREGSTVTILVSSGPGDETIPPVEGLSERSATRRLERAGFKVDIRRETSATVPKDRVIESSPDERSRLQRGRTVVLVVSSGPEQTDVPEVVGLAREEARSRLEAAGFEVTVREQESEDEEPGTVLAQSPEPGTAADEGSAVELTVAKRPARVAVPDVVGDEADDAEAELEAAGFRVRVRREPVATPDEDGQVLDQNPPAGSERRRGATVFITTGRFEPPADDGATPTPTPTPTP